jgi:uncharacterized membrane protein YhaH (DUF805 family)
MYKEKVLLGALHIAISIIYILISAAMCAILYSIDFFSGNEISPKTIHVTGAVLSFFLFLIALCGIAGGIGTMHNNQFSNTITLILGCIDLIFIPIGTAVGIYTILVFMKNDTSTNTHTDKKTESDIRINSPDYTSTISRNINSVSTGQEELSE